MIHNHHCDVSIGFFSRDWEYPISDINKKIFIIQEGSAYDRVLKLIEENKETIKDMDKIIIHICTEAFFSSYWFEISRILQNLGIEEKDMLFVDCGALINPLSRKWHHLSMVNVGVVGTSGFYPETVVKKDKILISLARIARPFRVLMTYELIKRNLHLSVKTIITCGAALEQEGMLENYLSLLPEDVRKIFPLTPFGKINILEHYDDSHKHLSIWVSALINVVMESGYDYSPVISPEGTLLPICESWNRHFFTEKTSKAFFCHQVPIFVAPEGYAEYLRSLGFDIFDDFIDHSYDKEHDPYVRIKLIGNEIERVYNYLLDKNVEDYSVLINNFSERAHKNYLNMKNMIDSVDEKRKEAFYKFIED